MFKKLINLSFCISAAYLYSQDVSVIKNTTEIYDHNYITGSARFSGMGGAMGALGGDISTISINPAGLGVAITGSFEGAINSVTNTNTSNLNGSSFRYKTNGMNMGQLGGILSFETKKTSDWKFVNLGINYTHENIENYVQTPSDKNIYEVIPETPTSPSFNLIYNGHAYDRTGEISKLNIGLAANYQNKIYVGGAINFHSANIFKQTDSFEYKASDNNETALYDKQNTPFSEASSGFSANVGVIAKLTNNLRLGASIETPTFWNSDRIYAHAEYSANGNLYTEDFAEARRFTTPAKLNLSGAMVANKNLSINVDYILNLGSPTYRSDGKNSATEQLSAFYNQTEYKNQELRAGLEYRINQFRLRGGYATANRNLGAENIDTILNATDSKVIRYNNLYFGNQKTISGGLGYNFKTFFVDVAFQNMKTSYENPFFGGKYYSSDFNDLVENTKSIVSKVDQNRNSFILGIGWKF